MRSVLLTGVLSLIVFGIQPRVWADTAGPFCDDVSWASDSEGAKIATLPSFDLDGAGGPYILNSVTVDVRHSGSAIIRADNDDIAASTDANARIIRTFSYTGPGIGVQIGTNTVQSPDITLSPDNGDGNVVDPTPPDGTDFGNLSYSNLLAGTFNPMASLYDTNGPSTVDFTVGGALVTIVNDIQFDPQPDDYDQSVSSSNLTVQVCVTYDYSLQGGPPPEAIPTVSEWGLIILTLLTLTAATLVFGRRRSVKVES